MNHTTLPLLALSATIGAALIATPDTAHADCAAIIPVSTPVIETPVATVPTSNTGDTIPVDTFTRGSEPASLTVAQVRATAQATATSPETGSTDTTAASTTTTTAAAASTACTQDAWGAPVAAQGLQRIRSSLAQTLYHLTGTRPQAGTRLYVQGSDQSRREGGNADTGASALRVSRADLTVGADHRFNDQWVAGASAGVGAPRMRWAGNTTRIDGNSGQLTAYGSWSHSSASYVAAAFSAESTRYSLHTDADNGTGTHATGINTGLSVSAGHDFSLGNVTLSPYGRVDRVTSRISSFEAGSSASKGRSVALSAGGQVQTSVPTSWGLIAPHARVELTRVNSWHIEGDSAQAYAASAGVLPSPDPTRIDRQFGQFGVGASALLQGGLTVFTDYDQGFAQKGVSSWRFTLGLRTEL